MYIHKEGRVFIFVTIIILVLANLVIVQLFSATPAYVRTGFLASLSILAFLIYFFRMPRYTVSQIEENKIMSPCSGRVVVIEEVEEPEYFNDKRLQVSIFMSPANVHVNWSPIKGIVKYLKYHPGNYLVAWHPKSSTLNERFTTVIENEDIEVLVRQIAGKVARKISNYLDEGEQVIEGMELGFIKFGSRVDLFLPLDTKLNIKLNEKVSVGKSVIGTFGDNNK